MEILVLPHLVGHIHVCIKILDCDGRRHERSYNICMGYHFVRLIIMVDYKDNTLNEENEDEEPTNVIAYRLVIQDRIQLLQDQQEF